MPLNVHTDPNEVLPTLRSKFQPQVSNWGTTYFANQSATWGPMDADIEDYSWHGFIMFAYYNNLTQEWEDNSTNWNTFCSCVFLEPQWYDGCRVVRCCVDVLWWYAPRQVLCFVCCAPCALHYVTTVRCFGVESVLCVICNVEQETGGRWQSPRQSHHCQAAIAGATRPSAVRHVVYRVARSLSCAMPPMDVCCGASGWV